MQALDPASGKTVLETLWGNAKVQGHIAGRNMAGDEVSFHKSAAFNVTRLAGLTTTIIGAVGRGKDDDLVSIARGDSETWRLLPDVLAVQCDSDVNRTRIMLGPKSMVGAVVMGDQTLSRPLHALIANRVDITPIREFLTRGPLADLINEFWLAWSRTVAAAQN